MLKLLKIKGDSLFPDYKEGDFVLISKSPLFIRRLQAGDTIVFKYLEFGTLIKRIHKIFDDGFDVRGTILESIDSRSFGHIPRSSVIGKVIWHIHKS